MIQRSHDTLPWMSQLMLCDQRDLITSCNLRLSSYDLPHVYKSTGTVPYNVSVGIVVHLIR